MSNNEPHSADSVPVWRREEPQSPCIAICQIHPSAKICIGCARTLEEITDWSSMTISEREAVVQELPRRFEALRATENRPSDRKDRGY